MATIVIALPCHLLMVINTIIPPADIDNSFRKSSDFETNDNAAGKHSVPEDDFAGSSETNVDISSEDSDEPDSNVPIFHGASPLESEVNGGLNGALFSLEEEVQVDLLRTLQRLKCPMIAYDEVMKWAVRSCSRGHTFHDLPISSRKTVVDKLRDRVDYEGLSPIVKHLYLPYSNCTVDVVYFNAHAVFNSFLSCPDLNRDENYIFHNPEKPDVDPFARPLGLVLGDINSGRSYLKTYDLLVKKAEDMLLPCVLAIDKTTCDIGGGGKLSLEPIVISYGLMKHNVRKTPAAMILSTTEGLHSEATKLVETTVLETKLVAATPLLPMDSIHQQQQQPDSSYKHDTRNGWTKDLRMELHRQKSRDTCRTEPPGLQLRRVPGSTYKFW
ncbi:hypothetical protein MHU86_5553 [Fragilaria crotonensis]|nr:hypothetical protein MHU86_5553 [Fragilaria crotonensis]